MEYPKSFEELMTCFKMLPGIGNKGAERMAYAIYDMSDDRFVSKVGISAVHEPSPPIKSPLSG